MTSHWHQTPTIRDLSLVAGVSVVLVVILILSIIGVTQGGQRELAARSVQNSEASAVYAYTIVCLLNLPPAGTPGGRDEGDNTQCEDRARDRVADRYDVPRLFDQTPNRQR